MALAILPTSLLIVIPSGWRKSFNFWTGPKAARIAYDITGCSAIAVLSPANLASPAPLILSTDNGLITVGGQTAEIDISGAVLEAWAGWAAPFDCDFRIRIIGLSGDVDLFAVQSDPYSSRIRVTP